MPITTALQPSTAPAMCEVGPHPSGPYAIVHSFLLVRQSSLACLLISLFLLVHRRLLRRSLQCQWPPLQNQRSSVFPVRNKSEPHPFPPDHVCVLTGAASAMDALTISRTLSFSVIVLSFCMKLPQISAIYSAGSSRGVNIRGYWMEIAW